MCFDGDEKKYEIWETKFVGHMRLLGLKDTVLSVPESNGEDDDIETDRKKNEEVCRNDTVLGR